MSEEMTNSLPKLLSFEHKCNQTKCKQMSEEFENMKKFILFSNQLNVFYLNQIKNTDISAIDDNNQRVFAKEKENVLKTIESEIKKIGKNLRLFLKDEKNTELKQKSDKTVCNLCGKQLSRKLLTTHLDQHLNEIFNQKSVKDITFGITIEELFDGQPNQVLEPESLAVVKEEPNDESNDNYSNFSDGLDGMADDFSEEEEEEEVSEEVTPKKKKKATKSDIKGEKTKSKSGGTSSSSERKRNYFSNSVAICDECGKTCKSSRHLSHHLSRVHNISKKTSNNCHLCDFGNVTIEELKTHFAEEHNIVNKWNFFCTWPECGEFFRFKTALDKHVRIHTGDLLFKCEFPGCDVQYNNQWRTVEHMRTHTGEKPFACGWPGCDKAFAIRSSYRHHIKSHNKERNCCHYPNCDKSYAFMHLLKDHILSVHQKDDRFRCTFKGCSRKFSTQPKLTLHLGTHTINRERYRCTHEGCDRSFLGEKNLQKHLEKPHGPIKVLSTGTHLYGDHKCDWPGCDFEASMKTNLRIHKMRLHTKERPERCTEPGCTFATVRKHELNVHMLKHTGETPYPCYFPNCSRRFKAQRSLDRHINKCHDHS